MYYRSQNNMLGFIAVTTMFFELSFLGSPASANLALVYSGPGSCREGCAMAAATVARRAGLRVKFVGPDFDQSLLREAADVWIQPGGDAIEVATAMPPGKKETLRQFIGAGGGYVGFCAGMFFADSTVDDPETIPGLGIIPGTTRDYKTAETFVILPIQWRGKTRYLYFERGGYFDLPENAPAQVIARYSTGEPAAILARFGNGRVAVSGPHPEAPASWLETRKLHDPDGPDLDLAEDMIRNALPPTVRRQLPRRWHK